MIASLFLYLSILISVSIKLLIPLMKIFFIKVRILSRPSSGIVFFFSCFVLKKATSILGALASFVINYEVFVDYGRAMRSRDSGVDVGCGAATRTALTYLYVARLRCGGRFKTFSAIFQRFGFVFGKPMALAAVPPSIPPARACRTCSSAELLQL